MDKEYTKNPKDITYANLSQGETEKLKDLEKTFNNEFHCDYYLMVMKNNIMKSWQMSGFCFHYNNIWQVMRKYLNF